MKDVKHIVLLFFIFRVMVLGAADFNDFSFVVSDLANAVVTKNVLKSSIDQQWIGLSVHLFYDQETDGIYLSTDKDTVTFNDLLDLLNEGVQSDKRKIIPVFIDYQGPSRKLKNALQRNAIISKLYYLNRGEKWPEIQTMLGTDKRIMLFSFQQNIASRNSIMYAWDHICEFPQSGLEEPYFDGGFANGDSRKELLLVRDMRMPKLRKNFNIGQELNQNQYYINHLLNRWRSSGKKPNFIFIDNFVLSFRGVVDRLSSYKSLKGLISKGGKPLDKVFWKHSNRCVTGGYFSFPYNKGEELTLTPFFPGYTFFPHTVVINNENVPNSTLVFTASEMQVNEGITGFFDFEKGMFNAVDKNQEVVSKGAQIVTDMERGSVLKLMDQSSLFIGNPETFLMRNNSFTVSAWVKIPEVSTLQDHSILGSNEIVFRKGLHLIIRRGRPYFGFYGTDLHSNKSIPSNEWTHIVYRYSLSNGEQAIYVNGMPEGASLNHASFLGDSSLVIGNSIRGNNFLNGYIDEVGIWGRALGDQEIERLYRGEIKPEMLLVKEPLKSSWIYLFVALMLLVVLVIVVFFWKRNSGVVDKTIPITRENHPNSVLLFGDFKVTNAEGEDVTYMFTPKLKELFLVLLLFTLKQKKGISTSRLTQFLWPGFSLAKAANNRSVTFNKLRKILSGIEGIDIQFGAGHWTMQLHPGVYCDYLMVINVLKEGGLNNRDDMFKFLGFVQRGSFLQETNWEWLDEFKGAMGNQVVDNLLSCAAKLSLKEDRNLIQDISKRVLLTDDLNEHALHLQIKLLVAQENMNQAKFEFERFCKRYYEAYRQPFPQRFNDFSRSEI